MKFKGSHLFFYNSCKKILIERHGETEYYLPTLERYVFATFKAAEIAEDMLDEPTVVQHTNKASHTNEMSSPKARMFALFNEQAMKLGKELGLQLVAPKAGRKSKTKKGFNLTGEMKVAL